MNTYDVVVLGTGAAGLTAALSACEGGAEVGLFEKADRVGGTSAWSGGMLWIPCNPHMAELGVADSRADALAYLESLSHGMIDPALAAAFVDTGPEMIRWLEERTPARFAIVAGFPDYHPERPGGKPGGGRSLECPLFAFDQLGPWAPRVTTGRQLAAGAATANITVSETPLGRGAPEGVPAEELERRRVRDERGPVRRWWAACSRAAWTVGSSRGPQAARSSWWSPTAALPRCAWTAVTRSRRAAAWCWPPAASSGTRSWCARSCAAR